MAEVSNAIVDNALGGYGKPPKSTQFKKGISGNPKGRPKKSPDFHSIFMKESKSFITINDNGQRRRISKLEGIVKQLTNKVVTETFPPLESILVFSNKRTRGSL